MEYMCLVLQILFLLGTFIFKTNDRYLVQYDEYYKKYLFIVTITNGMSVVTNCIIIFLIKELMIYVLVIQVLLMSLILSFYSGKAKKRYFKELIDIILKNDLQSKEVIEIRKIILEKYDKLYFIEDIKKCILNYNKNN